jgi:hypothetical protein
MAFKSRVRYSNPNPLWVACGNALRTSVYALRKPTPLSVSPATDSRQSDGGFAVSATSLRSPLASRRETPRANAVGWLRLSCMSGWRNLSPWERALRQGSVQVSRTGL